MSQFLKENGYQSKNLIENRVYLLSEKISNLKFGHKAQADRKFDYLDKQVTEMETDLDEILLNFNKSCFDVKQTFSKINKELSYDYQGTDHNVKEEIQRCESMCFQMTKTHLEERKTSDSRLSKYIDQKCAILRDLIEREIKERTTHGRQLEESLSKDLQEIKNKLDLEKSNRTNNIEEIHQLFLKEYEAMQVEFSDLCDKNSEQESQFYKMLRDILKKVKSEISQNKKTREEMQESILTLIEKICDKAMEEVEMK